MSAEVQPGGYAAPQSRNEAFGEGSGANPAPQLNTESIQQVDPAFNPDSINALANIRSANGLGAQDANRRTYTGTGLTPTSNGMSASTREAGAPILNQGLLNI